MAARPTLETVAARASVSRQTVSNVLNAPHLVRPETLDRVLAVIDELGYQPYAAARQLRTRRSRTLGLRMEPERDGINGGVFDRFLHAVTEHAQARGYRITLFTAADDVQEIDRYRELRTTADVDGFILTSTHHEDPRALWLIEQDIAFVTFGRPWGAEGEPVRADHPWVDVDGAAGTRAATEHLLGLGHARIGFIGVPSPSGVGDDRRSGWARAMAAAGAGSVDDLVLTGPDGVPTGARTAPQLVDRGATALVCASDSLALGAMAAVRELGRPVAVVGFDDTSVARAVDLTSVAQPLTESAGRAVGLLIDQLTGQGPANAQDRHVLLAPSLVVRASSTPPPSASPSAPSPDGSHLDAPQ